jgi:hypothetical protein
LYPELLSDDMRDNPDMMSHVPYLLHVASQRLLNSTEFALLVLATYEQYRVSVAHLFSPTPCTIYKHFSQSVRSDREFVLWSMHTESYRMLEFAPASVLDDRELVMLLSLLAPSALKYASDRLKHDASLMMMCMCLRNADEKRRCHEDFIVKDDVRMCIQELKRSKLCSQSRLQCVKLVVKARLSELESMCVSLN